MQRNIQGIIFDYGRTLQDHDRDRLADGATEVVSYLKDFYRLAIVSITWPQTMDKRTAEIRTAGWDRFMRPIFLVKNAEEKQQAYERVLAEWNLPPEQIAVVDDRTVRGIAWGNRRGCMTVWLKKGKFAHEAPDSSTGEPDYIISDIRGLTTIFL